MKSRRSRNTPLVFLTQPSQITMSPDDWTGLWRHSLFKDTAENFAAGSLGDGVHYLQSPAKLLVRGHLACNTDKTRSRQMFKRGICIRREPGSPWGLTFSWWGRYGLCLRHKPTELAHFFKNSVFVSVSVFMAHSTVFHFVNSPDNIPLSHSVLLVLFLPYWSFQLYLSSWQSPSAPALMESSVVDWA